ncbi:MAG TPA: type II toxin-antitoxin system prevent-host-death family antitoxin [Thermodesulfobacteriota bacterium]|nr:type II toxin-antitoxin system prevent-host-death family antitoxin [Deltaproteobacteria bacterium]HNU71358.1 type II toxin-antitoxin system prevent-host-death family antitoxin [Thermodesulfobacteriota bacterium]HOC38776.1 type II toxin-antitoxin system prevent-host-death family antitoxin [Thermodesulfobacteriota bacterium]
MHEAKSKLSRLGELAWQGEKIIIAKAGKPYLNLTPHRDAKKRNPGRLKGQIRMSSDFLKTSEDIIASFEGD